MRQTDHDRPGGGAGRDAGARLRLAGGDAPGPERGPDPDRGSVGGEGGEVARVSGPVEDRMVRVREAGRVRRELEVRAETGDAAAMSATDARWVMAVQASRAIEGGRSAVLRPEVRARLVSSATRMGLRPFDANLVLAIVQDAARRGETVQVAADRLGMVPGAERGRRRGWGLWAAVCLALSAVWAAALLWWLLG